MPEGERPEESPSSVGTTAVRGTRTFLNPDQLGAVGSYASFFGCLLIATVLAFQEIFSAAHDLVQRRAPATYTELVAVVLLLGFAVLFVVLPSIPVVVDIAAYFRRGERRTAVMLVFIALIYDFALCVQLTSAYTERFGP